jgi:hypothetical protein
VDDFSAAELGELARESTSSAVAERITRMEAQDAPPEMKVRPLVDRLTPASSGPRSNFLPVSEGSYNALKHPLLWRFFAALDENTQQSVLNGDEAALGRICDSYLKWFYKKARARRDGFDRNDAELMLLAIAQMFGDTGRIAKRDAHWTEPATSSRRFNVSEALVLFEEARSFGMITELEAGTWRWRHPFLCAYLARKAARDRG